MSDTSEFFDRWCRARPQDSERSDAEALGPRLAEIVQTAHATWPSTWLGVDDLIEALADRVDPAVDPIAALEGLHVEELYLALACGSGQPAAILALERAHGGEIAGALARVDRAAHELSIDDLRQILRLRLFVGDGARAPAITSYRGRGPLGRWLFVTALREVLQASRRNASVEAEVEATRLQLRQMLIGPQLEYLDERERDAFHASFTEGIDALEIRERNLLRHALVDGLNVRQIGRMYGVHFTTAARWLTRARDSLAAETRARMMQRLQTTPSELERIIGRVASQVELRLSTVFRPDSAST